jgi:hypothetical protein
MVFNKFNIFTNYMYYNDLEALFSPVTLGGSFELICYVLVSIHSSINSIIFLSIT